MSETCVLSERDLILARAGLFDHDGHGLVICHVLRQRKCLHHPVHGRSKRQPDRGIDLQTAKEIEAEKGTSCWLRLVRYRSV